MLRAAETDVESKPPRLNAGDHLDQPTFHRLYEAMPPGFRAELIGPGNDAMLLETVQRGLAPPEHAAFVEKLQLHRG
ncbi:MAG TPA: hypothetical protein VNH11_22505 [Pirellulales bacterium]|nr:hypothetical protein [Pirellulales bacterium]